MTYYRVLIHGNGIRIKAKDKSRDIVGFFTTRIVRANSESDASVRAMEVVRKQWASDKGLMANSVGAPTLSTEEVVPSRFLQGLLFRNKGHTFYLEDVHAI